MDVHAPSAADSAAIVVSDRIQPAHREGKRGALFMPPYYCIAIPAGIGPRRSRGFRTNPDIEAGRLSSAYQRNRRGPRSAPIATIGSAASVYQVATNSGESSKQWKA